MLSSDVDGKGMSPGQARLEWFCGYRRRIGFMDTGSVYWSLVVDGEGSKIPTQGAHGGLHLGHCDLVESTLYLINAK